MAREFDAFQKKAISSINNSVVSAGAGSGKTSVLSQRFTHLVVERHLKVDQILTLTFTKKATVEMYDRIYKTLKEKAPQAVGDFYKAHIQTLDSYCASIAREGARFYGLTPDIQVDNDEIIKQVSSMALTFIIEHRDNEAVKELAGTKSLQEIADGLFTYPVLESSTIAEPIDFDSYLQRQHKEIKDVWNECAKDIRELIGHLEVSFNNYSGNKKTKFFTELEKVLSVSIPEEPCILEEDFKRGNSKNLEAYILSLKNFVLIKLPGGRSNEELDSIKEDFKTLRDDKFPLLVSLANNVYGGSLVEKLLPLMKEFQDKVNDLKRRQGVLTYGDVSSLAICILRDYPEIRAVEKKKYKAIMIDEFQDNNSMQRDLLFMLSEKAERMEKGIPSVEELLPDRLFFVGDEKQSIYRFRGADVSVFRGLSKDFKDGNQELKTNYRSDSSLIQAFNTMFGGIRFPSKAVFPDYALPSIFYSEKESLSVPDYEAVYHKVELPKNKSPSFDKKVHFAFCDKNQLKDKNSAEEAEAKWVVSKIKELILGKEDGEDKLEAKDIAILFRNYKLQPLYERTLLEAGIPYTSEIATGFFNDGPVNDIFSFLRVMAYKSDSLSYMQLLKSPFVNLANEEANFIVSLGKAPFELSCEELRSSDGLVSEKSIASYEKIKKLYEDLMEKSEYEDLCKIVTALWYHAGYCYETKWNKKNEMYASLYDRIFELARTADVNAMSLASFVDSVRCYIDEEVKLENMDIPLDGREGVHLMSIYKSKGLEFPVVFVSGCHRVSMEDKNDRPVYNSKDFGLCVNSPVSPELSDFSKKSQNYFFTKIHEKEQAMQAAELRRLTYVAFTRAEHSLYVTGLYNGAFKDAENFLPGGNKNPKSIADVVAPLLDFYCFTKDEACSQGENFASIAPFDFIDITEEGLMDYESLSLSDESKSEKTKAELIEKALPLYNGAEVLKKEEVCPLYVSPSKHEDSYVSYSEKITELEEDPYNEVNNIISTSKFDTKAFGSIAHAYLEAKIKKSAVFVPSGLLLGLEGSIKKQKVIEDACKSMAENFEKSEICREASSAQWCRSEYSFKSKVGSKIVKGTLDLAYVKDERCTIVDYKTNRTIEPDLYYHQLACYRQALSQILNIKTENIRCILYYLRFGKAVDISNNCTELDINSL